MRRRCRWRGIAFCRPAEAVTRRQPVGIEFQGATKRYPGGTVAVDGLDLTVEDGTITVFVGLRGAARRPPCG
jgi:ABC-type transport system involved in cytochrome bd biosynthesis fused ATPase/permease subunit